ncbi:MAG: hypothetical protein ACAI43_00665 [Phycisphaerae bacterium]|nr:hypothetical protein [Tepidisphaeraceae bacterium]
MDKGTDRADVTKPPQAGFPEDAHLAPGVVLKGLSATQRQVLEALLSGRKGCEAAAASIGVSSSVLHAHISQLQEDLLERRRAAVRRVDEIDEQLARMRPGGPAGLPG